jgi:hypothetical protein
MIFVVGGRAFTSTILQKNCHEFISYESLLDDSHRAPRPPREQRQEHSSSSSAPAVSQGPGPHRGGGRRPPPLDLALAMPLVERALQVLERREVRPQLGLLKSTMLQLDSTFNEKAYGSGSFSDFVDKLKRHGMVNVTGGEGRYMISRKESAEPEKPAAKPEEAIPLLRDILESHRMEIEEGATDQALAEWVRAEAPSFDWKNYGFQEFREFLNYAQDKALVRIEPREEAGLMVYLGAEFHPPAVPEKAPEPVSDEPPEDDEPQPVVAGQPTARAPKPKRSPRKRATDSDAPPPSRPRRTTRKKTSE